MSLIFFNFLPLMVSLLLFFVPRYNIVALKKISLLSSFIILFLSLLYLFTFNFLTVGFQHLDSIVLFSSLNISYIVGIDGLSLFLIILTSFLIPLCILCSWSSITYKLKEFLILLFVIEFCLFNVFTVLDILLFYIFFESILIPMFLVVGIWGSRNRRIHAAYQFFLYTLVGSLVMLVGLLVMYFHSGSTNWFTLVNTQFPFYKEVFIWFTFFVSFAVKVPVVPVHIWLPEAHVEAPTAGSVLLAGILLKMGTYALLRFSIPFFPFATEYFIPLVFMISILSIIYSSFTTIRQIDLKKIIAYSSVAHMNFVTLGILSLDLQGIEGSIFLMLGHGVVSSALFLCIGILYDRYHTRLLPYYGGLVFGMPIFSFMFFIFTLANISLPGTINFVGEVLILTSVFSRSFFVTFMAMFGVVLGAVYAMWLYNRVVFGILKINFLSYFCDVNRREFFLLLPLVFLTFFLGFFPNFILDYLHFSSYNILLFLF